MLNLLHYGGLGNSVLCCGGLGKIFNLKFWVLKCIFFTVLRVQVTKGDQV